MAAIYKTLSSAGSFSLKNYFPTLSIEQKVRIGKLVLYTLSSLSTTLSVCAHYKWGSFRRENEISLAILGVVGFLATRQIKVVNRQCNVTISASRIKTVFLSLGLNFFYRGAKFLATKTGYFDVTYHKDCMGLSYEKGINAYYKIIGSKLRYIYFPSSTKLLVKTKNHPRKELINDRVLKQISLTAECLLPNPSDTYLEFDLQSEFNTSFSDGVCQGIIYLFISEYHKGRRKGLSFKDAAIRAAKPFAEGATFFACVMQRFHQISYINKEKFELTYPKEKYNDYFRTIISMTANFFLGHQLLLNANVVVDFTNFQSQNKLASLSDGAYDIATGWKLIESGSGWECKHHSGHAMALLVENKSFLIFDPSVGLFSHNDPDRYFEVLRRDEQGIVVYTSVDRS